MRRWRVFIAAVVAPLELLMSPLRYMGLLQRMYPVRGCCTVVLPLRLEAPRAKRIEVCDDCSITALEYCGRTKQPGLLG